MKKLLLDFRTNLIRAAVVNDYNLMDLIIENKEYKSIVSNIYVSVVKNILPSQFVFVDIGEEKNAFLQLNDNKENGLYKYTNGIKKLKIKQGYELLVQVIKDSVGTKGACCTSQLSFSGRNIVLLTNVFEKEIGVSKKIEDISERKRLKTIAENILPDGFGIIFRTNCEKLEEEIIKEELNGLLKLANDTIEKAKFIKGPYPLYVEEYIGEKAINELYKNDLDAIIVDGDYEDFKRVTKIIEKIDSRAKNKISLNTEKLALFESFSLDATIEKLLNKKIWLKSGGFLIIEQTEACVVIDVNTGKYSGKKSYDETIFLTNLEASKEICKQIKLRNLSGMIIIDFIDMRNIENKNLLISKFKEQLSYDRVSTTIVGMTKLGLLQLTRKKNREPISNILLKKCQVCFGYGHIVSDFYLVHKIINDLENLIKNSKFNCFTIKLNINNASLLESYINIFNDLKLNNNISIKFIYIDEIKLNYYEIEKQIIVK